MPAPGYLFRTDEATAEAVCVGRRIAIFVDVRAISEIPNDVSADIIEPLCPVFDEIMEREALWFGEPPDINGDGVVVVLMSPAVNESSRFVNAFQGAFRAGDLFQDSAYGNNREIIYLIVPDSAGLYGDVRVVDSTVSFTLPDIFAHEIQHLMNFYHHTMISTAEDESPDSEQPNISLSEETWLTEGLSHLVSDLNGYGQMNFVANYLTGASAQSPLVKQNSNSYNTAQRGGSYLFLRYLYERHRDPIDFVRRLIMSSYRGVENLERAFAGDRADFDEFKEFFLHNGIAIAFNGTNVTADPRFTYRPADFNEATQRYQGVYWPSGTSTYDEYGRHIDAYIGAFEYQYPTQKEIVGTGQWFVDFLYDHIAIMPPILPISAPPDSEAQGALIRLR